LLLDTILKMDQIFGIVYEVPLSYFPSLSSSSNILSAEASSDTSIALDSLPEEIKNLIGTRSMFKAQRKFAEADSIRIQLEGLGFGILDKKGGNVDIFKLPKS
jgi:cysteinyl-tRNA synthetase